MAEKDYQIDFFQVVVTATPVIPDPSAGFASLRHHRAGMISEAAGYVREVWRVRRDRDVHAYRGQLRKFRMSDFPEIGAVGSAGVELELDPAQGIIEKNFFQFESRNNLLVWHGNGHASTAGQFAKVLSDLWGTKVSLIPIPKAGAARRLLSGNVDIKKLTLSIPVPTDPNFYPAQDFSKGVIDMLRGAGGDRIKIEISADARRAGRGRMAVLGRGIKRAVAELAQDADATVAKVEAFENGALYPIDLVADRIRSVQVVEHEGRYPGDERMFAVLRAARAEVNDELEEYFGGENRLDI